MSYLFNTLKPLHDTYGKEFTKMNVLKNNKDLVEEITKYKWAASLPEGAHIILNNLNSKPHCKTCSNEVKFVNFSSGYRDFCSCSCRAVFYKCYLNGQTHDAKIKGATSRKNNYLANKDITLSKRDKTLIERHGSVKDAFRLRGVKSSKTAIQRGINHTKYHELYDKDKLSELLIKYNSPKGVAIEYYKDPTLEGKIYSRCTKFNITWSRRSKGFSVAEREIFTLVKELVPTAMCNVKGILSARKELDIYIPELQLAIEYCGLYWHSESRHGKYSHINKLKECNELGIRLITIFEDEWLYKKDLVISKLTHILGFSNKIYARKTVFKVLLKQDADIFHSKYHIQGSAISSNRVDIGLYYNEELVACMTVGKSRYNNKYDYELVRYSTSTAVVGGFSKLLSKLQEVVPNKTLVSYCDLRWGNGITYEKMGFTLVSTGKPSYFYFNPHKKIRHHRSQFMKHKVIKLGGDPSKTEYDNMLSMGYRRIWDCGCQVWSYKVAGLTGEWEY